MEGTKGKLVLYTDGSIVGGNPGGAEGWAVVGGLEGRRPSEIDKGFCLPAKENSSSRAELRGMIGALKYLQNFGHEFDEVIIYTDSKYALTIIKAIHKAKKNTELVNEARTLLKTAGPVRLEWIRGHNGNEGNSLADQIAGEMAAVALEMSESPPLHRPTRYVRRDFALVKS